MSWFSKKLKKITKIADPIGAKLRKSTGGSYGDPMNWYQSKPKPVVPYQRPEKLGLQADPGTGGPTVNLGGGGGNYTPNPFAQQMAQANALRGGQLGTQANMAPPMRSAPSAAIAQAAQAAQMQPQGMQNMMVQGQRPPGMMF